MPCSGNARSPQECASAFFVTLTPEPCAAVVDAQKSVATNWRSSFDSRLKPTAGAKPQRRRGRVFNTVARVARTVTKGKISQDFPPDKGVKKTIQKKRSAQSCQQHNWQTEEAKAVCPASFARSEKGDRMSRQEMETLLERDKVAFPQRPMFTSSGACRLKFPPFGAQLFRLIVSSPAEAPKEKTSGNILHESCWWGSLEKRRNISSHVSDAEPRANYLEDP